MILVEQHIIKKQSKLYNECDKLSFLAKNLYNAANYLIRQKFCNKSDSSYINFFEIRYLFSSTNQVDYRNLPVKVSNGILRLLDSNWTSFFKAIKTWSKNKNNFLGRPKIPNYKNKLTGRCIVPYEKNAISKKVLNKDGFIQLSKTNIKIKTNVKYEQLQAVRIVPKNNQYVIEVLYNVTECNHGLNKNNKIGIDLGLNNLAAITDTNGNMNLISGKPLKSINQYYNKKKAKLQSKLTGNKKSSNKIIKLTNKRNNKIKDYLHKASRKVIELCLTNNVGTIIIGKNINWKQNVNIGKKNNQNFVNIPFNSFIEMIQYKAKLIGIEVILTEESYTSKCSFIDTEPLNKHENYCGNRIYRGLFKTKSGSIINADINGSFNIIRKVVPTFNVDTLSYGIEGVSVHPTLIKVNLM